MSNMHPKRVTNLTKSVLNGCSEALRMFFSTKTKLLWEQNHPCFLRSNQKLPKELRLWGKKHATFNLESFFCHDFKRNAQEEELSFRNWATYLRPLLSCEHSNECATCLMTFQQLVGQIQNTDALDICSCEWTRPKLFLSMCHQSQIKFHSEVGDFFCPSINDRHDFWLPVNTVDADLWLCQQSSSLSPSIWLLLGIFNLPIRVITKIIIITILKIKGLYYTHFLFSIGADSWMMSWGGLQNVKVLLQNFCWALFCTISQVQ